jgi:hypothetical protein
MAKRTVFSWWEGHEDLRITRVIRGEASRFLLIIRILASQNKPLWVLIIRKAETHGFFHNCSRGTDYV